MNTYISESEVAGKMIKENIKPTLKLIQRSPDEGDGWRQVSDAVWPLVEDTPSELVELDTERRRIRMTDEGRAVLLYS